MADTKISDLTAATSVALTDTLPIVQSATTKEATFQMVSDALPQAFTIIVGDETTALTVADDKLNFRMPYAMTVTEVRASVVTAPTGAVITVDIEESGTTIFSTLLTIDATEKTSTTAATPAVISDASLADDAEISINVDTIGSGTAGAGLKITFIGTRT